MKRRTDSALRPSTRLGVSVVARLCAASSASLVVLALACGGDDGGADASATDGLTSTSDAGTAGTAGTTNAGTTSAGTSSAGTTSEGSSAGTTSAGTTSASTTSASTDSTTASTDSTTVSTTTTGESTTTGAPLDVPGGVFLWTGAGGGGPGTDLHVDAVESLLAGAGITVEVGDALPEDFVDVYGALVYMNPRDPFPAEVDAAAIDLVARGGRLVLIMEHCKNGCWGNADGHNALLEALGAGMRLAGDGGAPLSSTALTVEPWPPLTDGVDSLITFYSGHVVASDETIELGRIDGGDLVIGGESIGPGQVVAVADSSMFGYVLDQGDNEAWVKNFAAH